MDLIQAVVLGIVQGLTEFLPISSSAHLFLVPELAGWRDPGAGFTAVIQLGTIVAVLIYFREDLGRALAGLWAGIFSSAKRDTQEFRLGSAVAIGTLPAVVAGLALEKSIDREFRSSYVIVAALIGLALVLWLAEKTGKQVRKLEAVTMKDGLIVGLWQCLALVPGSSRSGSTISGALFLGLEREAAARFSFLLSVPVIVLSGLYKLIKDRDLLFESGPVNTVVATLVSFVVGYGAIAFLMKYLQNRTTGVFIGYRIVLGLLVLWLVAAGHVPSKTLESKVEVPAKVQRG